MGAPDFLVIGHLAKDKTAEGWRLGGTAAYASLTASRLGLRAAVLTSAASDLDPSLLLPDIDVRLLPASETTTFENIYGPKGRLQYVWARAGNIAASDVPREFLGAKVVLLGPLVGEVEEDAARCFPRSLLAISPQGWLRTVLPDGRVAQLSPRQWRPRLLLERSRVLFVSEEDLPPTEVEETLARWTAQVPVLAVTRGAGGARLWSEGRWRQVPAIPGEEIDPTGAGDVFAAAFLSRYVETGNAWQAALFAAAAASISLEAPGTAAIPSRRQVEERLRAYEASATSQEG
ncbi:MAG: PfkB family carbohydrate kinase [Dehalococcoidia bacterium]|nr:PfkB family carbohydrate kinase [Dehalococcoidia bacterium]